MAGRKRRIRPLPDNGKYSKFNQQCLKSLSRAQVEITNKVHLSSSLLQKAEGSFIFFRNYFKKFFPFVSSYAVHLMIILISLLVVWNNLGGRKDQIQGEEREGTSILFSGILKNDGESLVESRSNPDNVSHGIGGFISEMSGTVLAASDNSSETDGTTSDPVTMPTVQGNALLPLPLLEQEAKIGPVEEARTEIVKHTVAPGESVSSIALEYGVSVATILSANNLSETSYIRPDDILKIPPVSGVLYTVKPGDTLGEIAQTYQGDINKIIEYNNLGSAANIQIGQSLMIPGGTIPPPFSVPSEKPPSSIVSRPTSEEEESAPTPTPTPSIGGKGWFWPTTSHKINQYYSYRHHAVDIDGDTGSPIYSTQDGAIVFAGWRSGYGKCIIISHPSGYQSLYGHLSQYVRTSGQVSKGELIAYMGSTGWSTGPHVHFEIRTPNGVINPLNLIR